MKKYQLAIDGQLINYYKSGDGAIPIIFLHGWRSEGLVWSQIIEALGQNFSCYALDLPGFGSSPLTKEEYDLDDYVNIVLSFIQKLNLEKPVLVGHSFGGRISIKLSAKQKDSISKLVLVDSAGFVEEKNSGMKVVAKLVKPLFRPAFMQNTRKKIYKAIGSEDYLATPELQKTFLNIINENLEPVLKNITAKTLLVWGENDKDTPVNYGKRMNEKIRNSKLVVIESAGHFSFLDKPNEFYDQIITFLK